MRFDWWKIDIFYARLRYYRRVLEYIKHDLRLLNPKSECREAMDGTVTVASQSYSGSAR